MDSIYIILIISVLGPIIGSSIGVLKKPSNAFMYSMLAFAAGIMLAISFLQLIPQSIEISSILICSIGLIIGAVIMYGLDTKLIPHVHPELGKPEQGYRLKKTAIYLLLGIFLHNFPEGMAIASGTVVNFKTTFAIALAIAIHNIPEGICTSAPYYYSTRKKLKSFLVSSSTAIPIVVGFLFASLLFRNISPTAIGIIVAATAGLMIYITADELIPTACNKSNGEYSHSTIFSLIAGILLVVLIGLL
jgi:ZIP family zinc transporter